MRWPSLVVDEINLNSPLVFLVAGSIFMNFLCHAVIGAFALSCVVPFSARAFTANSANGFKVAQFGTIQIDLSRAVPLQRFVNRKALDQQLKLASARNTLDFRPDAPGLYRIKLLSAGDTRYGGVRAIVTIIGQNGLETVRARGENVQTWGGFRAPGFDPYNPLSAPGYQEDVGASAYPLRDTTRPRRGNGCQDQEGCAKGRTRPRSSKDGDDGDDEKKTGKRKKRPNPKVRA